MALINTETACIVPAPSAPEDFSIIGPWPRYCAFPCRVGVVFAHLQVLLCVNWAWSKQGPAVCSSWSSHGIETFA